MADPLDALKQLVASEGWQAFRAHAEQQWSDRFVLDRIRQAVSGMPAGDELSQHESARNVLAAGEAVAQLLKWPEQEIQKLGAHQPPKGADTPVGWFKRQVGR